MNRNTLCLTAQNTLVPISFKRLFANGLPFGVVRRGFAAAPEVAFCAATHLRKINLQAFFATTNGGITRSLSKFLLANGAAFLLCVGIAPTRRKVTFGVAVKPRLAPFLDIKKNAAVDTRLFRSRAARRELHWRAFVPSLSIFVEARAIAVRPVFAIGQKADSTAFTGKLVFLAHLLSLPQMWLKTAYYRQAIENMERVNFAEEVEQQPLDFGAEFESELMAA